MNYELNESNAHSDKLDGTNANSKREQYVKVIFVSKMLRTGVGILAIVKVIIKREKIECIFQTGKSRKSRKNDIPVNLY